MKAGRARPTARIHCEHERYQVLEADPGDIAALLPSGSVQLVILTGCGHCDDDECGDCGNDEWGDCGNNEWFNELGEQLGALGAQVLTETGWVVVQGLATRMVEIGAGLSAHLRLDCLFTSPHSCNGIHEQSDLLRIGTTAIACTRPENPEHLPLEKARGHYDLDHPGILEAMLAALTEPGDTVLVPVDRISLMLASEYETAIRTGRRLVVAETDPEYLDAAVEILNKALADAQNEAPESN